MPKFGNASRSKLATCHPLIQETMNEAIKSIDFGIIEGHRTRATHQKYLDAEPPRTTVPYSKTNHRFKVSRAVDICPWDQKNRCYNWNDIPRFAFLAGIVMPIADRVCAGTGWKMYWGGDWDGDIYITTSKDTNFMDMPHYELRRT